MVVKHYHIEEETYEEQVTIYKTGDGMFFRDRGEAERNLQNLKDYRTKKSFVTMKIEIPFSGAGIDDTWTHISNDEILEYFIRLAEKGTRYSNETMEIKSFDDNGILRIGDWVSCLYFEEDEGFGETSKRYYEMWTLGYFKSNFLVKTILRVNRILSDGEFK